MTEPIQTEWVILSGAPSCGKSSLLSALEAIGHSCSPEAARAYFENKLSTGSKMEDLLAWDYSKLGLEINEFEEASRAHLPKDKRIFLDRVAAIESMAYAEVRGTKTSELLQAWPTKYRYHTQVFLLDPLPVQLDDIRSEDEAQAKLLDRTFEKIYKQYGYEVIRVPAFPLDRKEPSLKSQVAKSVAQRLEFILARLTTPSASADVDQSKQPRLAAMQDAALPSA